MRQNPELSGGRQFIGECGGESTGWQHKLIILSHRARALVPGTCPLTYPTPSAPPLVTPLVTPPPIHRDPQLHRLWAVGMLMSLIRWLEILGVCGVHLRPNQIRVVGGQPDDVAPAAPVPFWPGHRGTGLAHVASLAADRHARRLARNLLAAAGRVGLWCHRGLAPGGGQLHQRHRLGRRHALCAVR